jgi:hypothetical protein
MRNGRLAVNNMKWEGTGSGIYQQSVARTKKYYLEFADPTNLDSNFETKNKIDHLLK